MAHIVKLDYFKDTGKWYTEGEYETPEKSLYEIWDEVREMMDKGKLPGLIEGHSEFIVLINVPDHPHDHPRLIIPEVEAVQRKNQKRSGVRRMNIHG